MANTSPPSSPAKKATKKEKRTPQSRSDKRAEREIRYAQISSRLMIPREPFKRLAKAAIEEAPKSTEDDSAFRIGKGALLTLQEAAENHLTVMFQQGRVVAHNNKHRTLMRNDWWTALDVMRLSLNQEPLHESPEPESRRKGRSRAKAKTAASKEVEPAAPVAVAGEKKRKRETVKPQKAAVPKKKLRQEVASVATELEEGEEEEESEEEESSARQLEMEVERESDELLYEEEGGEEEVSDLY